MTAQRQAAAFVRCRRAAALTPHPATLAGSSSPVLERARRGALHLGCWTDPVIASRLDRRLRLALTEICPVHSNSVLAATFADPIRWNRSTLACGRVEVLGVWLEGFDLARGWWLRSSHRPLSRGAVPGSPSVTRTKRDGVYESLLPKYMRIVVCFLRGERPLAKRSSRQWSSRHA